MPNTSKNDLLYLTVDIVSSYVQKQDVDIKDIDQLLQTTYSSLKNLEKGGASGMVNGKKSPAVPVADSVTPDYLICLEDGKKFKLLKRHLRANYGLSPDAYRKRWGLPESYPMVAPNYAKKRSLLAKEIGLGKNGE